MATPMFIVTGFLDSGKTTMIKDTLMEQEWIEPGLTLLLLCEEGEEEYPEEYLKEKNKEIKVIGIEPKSSPLITENKSGPHKIQGIGANFIPKIYDKDIVDKVITVSDVDSYETVRLFANKLGILIGISSGANIFGAMKLSDENPDKIIVTVAPDGVDKYMSMGIF